MPSVDVATDPAQKDQPVPTISIDNTTSAIPKPRKAMNKKAKKVLFTKEPVFWELESGRQRTSDIEPRQDSSKFGIDSIDDAHPAPGIISNPKSNPKPSSNAEKRKSKRKIAGKGHTIWKDGKVMENWGV